METKSKRTIPEYVKIMMFLLIVLAIHFGRKQLIDMKHPYKDLEIIGTWDYGYSVAFDADEKLVREDKSLFSLEMYTETEIVMNDDGTFRVTIEDCDITGAWEPDEKNSNIFHLTPDETDKSGILRGDEIRWDKGEDRLCIGLTRDTAPDDLQHLFRDTEAYRYIFCKTYRDKTKVVYRDNSDDHDDDDWGDGDYGAPYRYDP